MSDTVACRICLEDTGVLISPCGCKGSTANVHEACLKKWVAESGSEVCEICKEEYARRDALGCNITNYLDGMFRSRYTSAIETFLVRVSGVHMIVGILMYAWSPMDQWMFATSVQTVSHSLSIIMFQIYNYHVDFFVLRVLIYWSCAYLLSNIIVGLIRTMDNEEECGLNCFKLARVGCTEECVVWEYYQKKDTLASNVLLVRFIETVFLLVVRCISLCFTHMRRTEYYSFKRNGSPLPEEEGLLSEEGDAV